MIVYMSTIGMGARSVRNPAALVGVSQGGGGSKAGASSTHSIRFARCVAGLPRCAHPIPAAAWCAPRLKRKGDAGGHAPMPGHPLWREPVVSVLQAWGHGIATVLPRCGSRNPLILLNLRQTWIFRHGSLPREPPPAEMRNPLCHSQLRIVAVFGRDR